MYAARAWRSRSGSLVAVLGVLFALTLALAASADAKLYWAEPSANRIGSANKDGSGVNRNFITLSAPPRGVAISPFGNPPHIWWTTSDGWIGRANIDGTNVIPHFIWANSLDEIAADVDSRYVYWSTGRAIGRANVDGSGANPTFITLPNAAAGLAVDFDRLYWTSPWSNAIGRANLDGSGADPALIGNARYWYGTVGMGYPQPENAPLAVEPEKFSIFYPNRLIFWPSTYMVNELKLATAYAVDGSHINETAADVPYNWAPPGMVWSYYDNDKKLYFASNMPRTEGSPVQQGSGIWRSPRDLSPYKQLVFGLEAWGVAVDSSGLGGAPPRLSTPRRLRLRAAMAGGGMRGVRARLRAPGSGRACLELRLRARTAKRLGLRPKRSERRLGKLVGRRRCLKITSRRTRKLAVRFSRRARAAVRKLVRPYGPRRLAGLRRVVRRKGLTVRVRVVWRDALGYRHPTSRPVRLVR